MALLLCGALLLPCVLGTTIDVKQTYGIFGAIQFVDKPTTATRLLEQCYAGFALNSCEDLNATTSDFVKDYAFSSQFTVAAKRVQQYCLQCCTQPVPLVTGADETWNLSCPLNDLQRLSVSKGRRIFRFARRNTLDDEEIVNCLMPNRTQGTYLDGYTLTLWIIERSANFGAHYWRSVVNCSATITETAVPPTKFSEVIRIRSIPTPQSRPTAWVTPVATVAIVLGVLLSLPIYNATFKGQRCLHCGSWLVVVRQMCVVCICVSCQLHPPPAKVYVDKGDPHREPSVHEPEESSASSDDDSEESDDDATASRVKNIKSAKRKK